MAPFYLDSYLYTPYRSGYGIIICDVAFVLVMVFFIFKPYDLTYSTISALPFQPDCPGDFNEDSSAYVITCTTPDGSQTIRERQYFINGVDQGSIGIHIVHTAIHLFSHCFEYKTGWKATVYLMEWCFCLVLLARIFPTHCPCGLSE